MSDFETKQAEQMLGSLYGLFKNQKIDDTLHLVERTFMEKALNDNDGNAKKAARQLQTKWQTFYRKMEVYKIQTTSEKKKQKKE
jgi:DNA-binding NtrC family response regulator